MASRNSAAESKSRTVTIREVARLCSVSTASVSRALNGLDGVSSEIAQEIRDTASKLGYYPSSSARALVTGSSRTFGLLISDVANPFFAELLREFERQAEQEQYEVMVANIDSDPHRVQQSMRRLLERNVDGVAVMMIGQMMATEELRKRKIPLVFLEGKCVGKQNSNIVVDSATGIQEAVAHLKTLGHRSIAYLGASNSIAASRSRLQSLVDATVLRGMKLPDAFISTEYQPTMQGGAAGMEKLLKQRRCPTCVLAFNDAMAFGAMRTARQMKVSIPEDISVVGFDDVEMAEYVEPQLSTIHFSRVQLANLAFKELLRLTRGVAHSEPSLLRTRLVVRSSTGRCLP